MGTNKLEDLFKEAPPLKPEDESLVRLYEEIGRPLDDLIYSEDFDRLYERAKAAGDTRDKREMAHRLFNLRKAARLPRLGRGLVSTVRIVDDEWDILADLIPHFCGTIGQRDRLAYSPEFDALVAEFNRQTGRPLTPHDVWKLVARIAK